MSAIEFLGFSDKQVSNLKQKMKPIIKKLNFKEHIVWIEKCNCKERITNLKGESVSFVRFYTRSLERAKIIEKSFTNLFAVEVILIRTSVINGIAYNFVEENHD